LKKRDDVVIPLFQLSSNVNKQESAQVYNIV